MLRVKWLKKSFPFILLFVFWSIFFFFTYSNIVKKPSHFLFSLAGDGIKNYYTYSYYIKNDKSYINSMSSNYPYGEHFSFLDSTPALSIPLKKLCEFFPKLKEYDIAIFNYFLMFSFVLGSWCLYLILRYYKIPIGFSIFLSFLVVLFSPQFTRLFAHYALVYTPALLLSWYLLIRFLDTPTLKWSVLIIIVNLFHFFIHIYFPMIFSLFAVIVYGTYTILHYKSTTWKFYIQVVSQILLPILIFSIFMYYTDTHTNRTESPAGLGYHIARLWGVFLSKESLFKPLYLLLFREKFSEYEGISYIGLAGNLSIIFCIAYLIFLIARKKYTEIKNIFFSQHWLLFSIAGIIILIFATNILYKNGLIIILDYIKPLRNLRSLGRFAWMFYYIISVYAIVILYRIYQTFNQKTIHEIDLKTIQKNRYGKLFILSTATLFLIIHTIETIDLHRKYSQNKPQVNLLNEKCIDNSLINIMQSIKAEDYQGILGVPIANVGSEDFLIIADNGDIHLYQMLWSYYTHLPLVNNVTSRTSLTETKNILQLLLLPEYYDKTSINKVFSSPKPLLCIIAKHTKQRHVELIKNLCSKKIYEDHIHIVAELYPDKLLYHNNNEIVDKYKKVLQNKHQNVHGWIFSDTNKIGNLIQYYTYDSLKSETKFMGEGALVVKNKRGKNYDIMTFKPENMQHDTLSMECSFWLSNKLSGGTLCGFAVEEQNLENGKKDWVQHIGGRFPYYIYQDWSLIKIPFVAKKNCTYKIILLYEESFVKYHVIDNILLKPQQIDCFYKISDKNYDVLIWNNEYIKLNKGIL